MKEDKLERGDLIFSDQFQSSLPGRVFGKRGAAITTQKYTGGTLFADASSKYMKICYQVSLGGHETVASKTEFEREAAQVGVTVKNYRTDNGVYTSAEFMNELMHCGQA